MSEAAWHLTELREHIRFITPREKRAVALEIVHSIDRSIAIFLYHLYTPHEMHCKGSWMKRSPPA